MLGGSCGDINLCCGYCIAANPVPVRGWVSILVARPSPSVALGVCTIMGANSLEANRQGSSNYLIHLR